MKAEIHPKYHEVTVTCACGATFKTGTTKEGDVMKVDICSNCHPFFTGKQKLVDTGGRIDKFKKRYGLYGTHVGLKGNSFKPFSTQKTLSFLTINATFQSPCRVLG